MFSDNRTLLAFKSELLEDLSLWRIWWPTNFDKHHHAKKNHHMSTGSITYVIEFQMVKPCESMWNQPFEIMWNHVTAGENMWNPYFCPCFFPSFPRSSSVCVSRTQELIHDQGMLPKTAILADACRGCFAVEGWKTLEDIKSLLGTFVDTCWSWFFGDRWMSQYIFNYFHIAIWNVVIIWRYS